jgi:DNA modification methylase
MKPLIHDLQVEYQSVGSLVPSARNPRTHSPKQIRQLVESMRTFGFINPLLIDANRQVLAGHGRLAAAKALELEQVPTIRLDHLTKAQRRAYVLADNKLAELAGWDRDLLALELQELSDLEMDFDLTVTGFEMEEIELFLDTASTPTEDPAADILSQVDPTAPSVTVRGDLWQMGSHRLYCGDATQPDSFVPLMGSEYAQMVFVDPPYNVPITGHVCGLGHIQHGDFVMAAGELSESEFTQYLRTLFAHLVAHSQDGAIHFICMDWRHLYELLTAARLAYTDIKNLCIWNKTNGGMGTFYRSKHELILVAKQGATPHINNFELGQHGRYRTNVWDYPGINAFHEGRLDELAMHPTVKPVALIADAIKDCSHRGGLILDCCAGSGTTVIAAEQTGRTAYLMELDPRYVDTTIHRWQAYTGHVARQASTGLTFAEIQEARGHGDTA